MIRTCQNCAGMLKYDIQRKGLYCENCGSLFDVGDFENNSEGLESQVPFIDKDEMLDVNIFSCSACGAEISVTDTEASTFCIYCGNPTILFNRVGKMRRPDAIIPFKVTKDEAMRYVSDRLSKGFFIPKEIKNFKPELLRGIYIPYYVSKVEYDSSMIISAVQSSGKNSSTYYYSRSGYATMPWLTTDASKTLADNTSQRLEPYRLKEMVDFNEDYLVGFYSDMSDVDNYEAIRTAKLRARQVYNDEMLKSVKGSSKKIVQERYRAEVYDEPITAMLPAWFLTFRYNDKPYTIIVNGQTGKTVGGVPWKKALFAVLTVILAILFTVAATLVLRLILPAIFDTDNHDSDSVKIIIVIVAAAISGLIAGINKIKKVLKSINRTTASTLTSYVGKRQKGE